MRTDAGRDWQARVMADTASDATGVHAPANWIALSSDDGAASPAHTTLTGELTGGTLARAQASFAHTDGTASYTLIKTFTSDRIVNVHKYGVFNASSDGVMAFEMEFDDVVPMKVGDSVQVVDTISL